MRKAWIAAVLALGVAVGCTGKDDPSTQPDLQPGVVLRTDRTRLLFGQDFGNATYLGTQPANTLQIISGGQDDLVISKIEVIAGTDDDGGALDTTGVFTATGPDKAAIAGGQTGFVQVVFNPTAVGLYGAVLSITSNAPSSPTRIVLSGDCVTPLIALAPGSATSIDLGSVQLIQKQQDDGGLVTYPDGGPAYAAAFASASVFFVNPGTADLTFGDPSNNLPGASLATDAGTDSPFELCQQASPNTPCDPGPKPNRIARAYSDGGLAQVIFPDGGSVTAARLELDFSPATPGDFSQHVIVTSDATNTPELILEVHGTATP